MPSEEDRDTATDNTHKQFGEVRPCGFRVMQAHRPTDILITILHAPHGAN